METQLNTHLHDGSDLSSNPTPPLRTAAATRARLKHGLYSRDIVIPGERQEEFDALRADMLEDQRPQGREERELVERMVRAQWRLLRLEAAETGVFAVFDLLEPEADTSRALWLAQCFEADCGRDGALERLSLLQQRLLNQFLRCGRRLDALREQHRCAQVREAAAIRKLRPDFARDAVVEYAEPAPAPVAETPPPVATGLPEPAAAGVVPAADSPVVPALEPTTAAAPEDASDSSGDGIGENADRGAPPAPRLPSAPDASPLLASEGDRAMAQAGEPPASPEAMARLEAEDERVRRLMKGSETES